MVEVLMAPLISKKEVSQADILDRLKAAHKRLKKSKKHVSPQLIRELLQLLEESHAAITKAQEVQKLSKKDGKESSPFETPNDRVTVSRNSLRRQEHVLDILDEDPIELEK